MPSVSEPTSPATLGIIGGAGVGAAARLYIDVAAGFRAAHGRLPRILLWNAPFSDALEHAFTGGAPDGAEARDAERLVAEAVARLSEAGATVVAMPCNSLQRAAAGSAAKCGVPFVDMIGATIDAVRAGGDNAAVLLATEATRSAGIYEGHGVEIITPPPHIGEELSKLIGAVVGGASDGGRGLRSLIERACRPGAAVVIGCTDICGLLGEDDASGAGAVVDSLACLTSACVESLRDGVAVATVGPDAARHADA
jgi:aspartate racemase